jgi:hypothetical protein
MRLLPLKRRSGCKNDAGYDMTGWLSVNSVPSQTGWGTVSKNITLTIGSLDSKQFLIGIEVENCDFDSNQSQVLVTVSKPLDDFVTGGGYLKAQQSAGRYAAESGSKINFGYNVKFNRQRTNLQGNRTSSSVKTAESTASRRITLCLCQRPMRPAAARHRPLTQQGRICLM